MTLNARKKTHPDSEICDGRKYAIPTMQNINAAFLKSPDRNAHGSLAKIEASSKWMRISGKSRERYWYIALQLWIRNTAPNAIQNERVRNRSFSARPGG